MLESERLLVEGAKSQLHNDYIEDEEKFSNAMMKREQEARAFKAMEARKKAEIEAYRQAAIRPQAPSKELVKEMLGVANYQIQESNKREAEHFARLNRMKSIEENQEGLKQYDKLLGIERERLEYINSMIRQAESLGNEELLREYETKKEESESAIQLYQSRYNEFNN